MRNEFKETLPSFYTYTQYIHLLKNAKVVHSLYNKSALSEKIKIKFWQNNQSINDLFSIIFTV